MKYAAYSLTVLLIAVTFAFAPTVAVAQKLPQPNTKVVAPLKDTLLEDVRFDWRLAKDTTLTVSKTDGPYIVATIPGTPTRGRIHLNQVALKGAPEQLGKGSVPIVRMMQPQLNPKNPLLFVGDFSKQVRAVLASGRGAEILSTKDEMLGVLNRVQRSPLGPLRRIGYLGILSDTYRTVGDQQNALAYLKQMYLAAKQFERDIDAGRYGRRLPATFKLDAYRRIASAGWAETMQGRLASGELKLTEATTGIDDLLPDKDLHKVFLGLQFADDGQSHMRHGSALIRQGRIDKATPVLERAQRLSTGARKYYDILGINASGTPGDTEAWLAIARVDEGKIKQAFQTMELARRKQHRHAIWTGFSNDPHREIIVREENEPYMTEAFHRAISLAMQFPDEKGLDSPVPVMAGAWVLNNKLMSERSLRERMEGMRKTPTPKPGMQLHGPFRFIMGREYASLASDRNISSLRGLAANYRLRKLAKAERELARREFEALRFLGHGLVDARVPDMSPPAGIAFNADGKAVSAKPNEAHDKMSKALWVEVADLQAELENGQVLIEFVRHRDFDYSALDRKAYAWRPDRYAAWIMPQSGDVAQVDLGPADAIDQAIRKWDAALRADRDEILDRKTKVANRVKEELASLGKLLVEPIRKHLDGQTELILSPDSELWMVPFAALPWNEQQFLLEQFRIRLVTTGRRLVKREFKFERRGDADPEKDKIDQNVVPPVGPPLVLADPDFDAKPETIVAAEKQVVGWTEDSPLVTVVRRGTSSLPPVQRLDSTRKEAADIAPALEKYCGVKPKVLLDESALELAVSEHKRPQVLVLATHGFFLPEEHPLIADDTLRIHDPTMRCGLLLAGCNRNDDWLVRRGAEGVLSGYEVESLDLRGTELVVLSACETALGEARYGEGVAGLRQAFQVAGAESVVASLWQIPDAETAIIMKKFFERLADGEAKADALRNAQLDRIKERRDRYNGDDHPFHWAALTITE